MSPTGEFDTYIIDFGAAFEFIGNPCRIRFSVVSPFAQFVVVDTVHRIVLVAASNDTVYFDIDFGVSVRRGGGSLSTVETAGEILCREVRGESVSDFDGFCFKSYFIRRQSFGFGFQGYFSRFIGCPYHDTCNAAFDGKLFR